MPQKLFCYDEQRFYFLFCQTLLSRRKAEPYFSNLKPHSGQNFTEREIFDPHSLQNIVSALAASCGEEAG